MSRQAAFFDLDRTVVRTNTGTLFATYAYRHGRLGGSHVLLGAWWATLHRLTLLNTDQAMTRAAAIMAGENEEELADFCRTWFTDRVKQEIAPSARQAIERHRQKGDVLVLLTAASIYAARPVADHLGLDHVLATHLEVRDGRLTGKTVDPPCARAGKVYWAEELARREKLDLAASTFYTDSHDDLQMLLRVGEPVIVNGDVRLAWLARQRQWRQERWR